MQDKNMHVKAYGGLLFILCVWMQPGNLVRAQDCQLASFQASRLYDSNFDTTGLKDSYSPGSEVRVPCNVGFVGFFKLICLLTGWEHRGSKCEPRSCGHPGDADSAEFQLVKGDDYVFGSEVQYTCKPGFQMVSRSNRRRCDVSGWDGFLPVCEAIHCPEIYVDDDMQVTGEHLEATTGHVLLFRCKQNHLEVDGPKEIYCGETGQWSDKAPTCKARTCGPPGDVPFAELNRAKEDDYVLESEVQYSCQTGYRAVPAGSGTRRCTLNGWKWDGVEPRCEITRCPVIHVANNIETNGDYLKAIPGHVLGFTCTSPGMILTGAAEIRCKENGDWSERPPTCKACSSHLGIKDDLRRVSDDQMTASSARESSLPGPDWLPHFGRLDEGGARNAWSAATNDQYQWLQVDLGCSKTITGIITQGDGGVFVGKSYIKSFKVSYSDDGGLGTVVTDANGFEKIFDGNIDSRDYKTNEFEPPVTGRYVRVLPQTWENRIALRMELLGCEPDHGVQLHTQQQQRMCVPPPETQK